MKVLILGLGNPILSDDGIGLMIAQLLKKRMHGIDVVFTPLVGLDLLDVITGYETIFLIDACMVNGAGFGTLVKLTLQGAGRHLCSSHGLNFFELVQLGEKLGLAMPQIGAVYGIQIAETVSFGQGPTPALHKNLGAITDKIMADIRSYLTAH